MKSIKLHGSSQNELICILIKVEIGHQTLLVSSLSWNTERAIHLWRSQGVGGGQAHVDVCRREEGSAPGGCPHRKLGPTDCLRLMQRSWHSFGPEFRFWTE